MIVYFFIPLMLLIFLGGFFFYQFKTKSKQNSFLLKSLSIKYKKLCKAVLIFTLTFVICNAPLAIIGKITFY
jgi:hypothetical protein